MSEAANITARTRRSFSLRRDIIAILTFKLLALIALRFLFFDERPQITPTRVEQHLLDPSPASETDHDRR
ncbi:MAG TPA: hypothetical protein PKE27_10030 [Povalibacter sp.]|uniref:cytochrome oxidase putative small subunit CydP n=1 Tax=Povalibacter sp. TaxID=1962978 RepID=UPI002B908A08|nr:cytochrome oxidase putative small subunit CydP [Povalibacter sp.]HMN44902.1 hypothetical protein [Povalibacter sp.]